MCTFQRRPIVQSFRSFSSSCKFFWTHKLISRKASPGVLMNWTPWNKSASGFGPPTLQLIYLTVYQYRVRFWIRKTWGKDEGPFQMSNFTCAESNANEKNLLFLFICIRFGTCKVWHLKRALDQLICCLKAFAAAFHIIKNIDRYE